MEELIKRLFEELAKQTARAAEAEKARDQYESFWHMYKSEADALRKQVELLKKHMEAISEKDFDAIENPEKENADAE